LGDDESPGSHVPGDAVRDALADGQCVVVKRIDVLRRVTVVIERQPAAYTSKSAVHACLHGLVLSFFDRCSSGSRHPTSYTGGGISLMIRNDRELQSVLEWIEYWRENRSGEQSWIGNEQARQRIAVLRKQVDEYARRMGKAVHLPGAAATPQAQPEASTRTINRAVSVVEPTEP
jgi:hypothetical protein